MIPTPLSEVADIIGAHLVGTPVDPLVSADVEVDSRRVRGGGLFVALPGERTDGHDHAAAAIAAGAVAAVTARPVEGVPCLVVEDPLAALQALARELWTRQPPLTFGITGSSGKTSTKDLLAQVLAGIGPTLSPVGSFNNELGLPLTALRREVDTRFAALEYSARGLGHIRFLTEIIPPQVGIVLNVGSAHLGEFGSAEAIAQAKGELIERCALAVLNADDPRVLGMRERAGGRVVTYGTGDAYGTDAQYRAEGIELDEQGRASFTLVDQPAGQKARVQLRGHGGHQVSNALAVAAAVLASDPDGPHTQVAEVAESLSAAVPTSRWRMEVTDRSDGVTVVNDAYNANPESMRAALAALAAMAGPRGRRTWAVLGPMGELGERAHDSHVEVGRLAVTSGAHVVLAVDAAAQGIVEGATEALHDPAVQRAQGGSVAAVPDVDGAVGLLQRAVRPGDVVLIKASRAAGLERIAEALLAGPTDEGAGAAS